MQLEPLSYHTAVATRLETAEAELWAWFRSDAFAEQYKAATTADLLRTAIRLERSGPNERRYALAEQARDRLGITVPITLYQMQDTSGTPNAFLIFVPGEIVIGFVGRILELLNSDAELLDLLGHEISHFKLFTEANGRFHTVDRLLTWLLSRDHCPPEFAETWRRNRLYTEIYCDVGGLIACGDRDATIQGLVKSVADFKDADAASYLKQAEELMVHGAGVSRGTTHPELYVRVLAVAHVETMQPSDFDDMLRRLIAGQLELGCLDLLDQIRLAAMTRQLVDRVLSEPEARTDHAVAHACQLFHDYAAPTDSVPRLPPMAEGLSASTIDYLCYVLLDLSTADDAGSRGALSVAAGVADEMGIGAKFRELARAELKGRRAILAGLTSRAA